MQLTRIKQITATLILKTGLHIGAGDTEMRIGGTDNPVVKSPLNGQPYIPGSSLKGKIRSLLEWQLGLVTPANGYPFSFQHLAKHDRPEARDLLRLFGGAPGGEVDDLVKQIGPTRSAFWDCALNGDWVEGIRARNLLSTEAKSENSINRIAGVAENPRFTERVIAGAEFDFRLSLKVIDNEDLLPLLLRGLKLLELDSLGGSGSRGYGKLALSGLALDGQSIQADFDTLQPFATAA
ncbi:MAG: type III-A CRISPR-associated RAMP protein Csm3 [Candidatus Accumulibacter phosphatis]|jgi:CRISPR-associated protein Csm3|uniref:CRISPR system Cms endoribonuclease Csm3 n=2 Tax=Candidatus Accumulibacter TaxID=327159 RepID=A0A6A7RP72_9PROT|nr:MULTISPECIES: type III-A CRISPR-associated RAMP protein Csm3 [Candidatus Accumulibacter]MQM29079.1 type III-A CRISPR-associated RAMP protein Csm3 [Candidatus Accumulibacter phosphatis]NMQ29190.1 type III-A CRISPR-associated RAMP protein Csm3 [Candidatus Accumulibacter phosphatis]RDE50642.1 MAG: type III-A CRISPR-associated RAMP protein Csm3 [Candidatus Accumulibacter meliphilus]